MSDATTAVRPSLRDPRNWPMFAAMLGAFAIARLPWMLQRALGRGVGWITWRLLGSRRRAAEVNLQLCFPEKDEAWRQRLVRDSFDALGVGVFECIRAWWGSIDSIRPQVQIEGLEHLRQMQAEMGKPGARIAIMADIAVHIAHQLAYERKAKALTGRLGRDKWLEHVALQSRVDARAIVADGDFDRQRHRTPIADRAEGEAAELFELAIPDGGDGLAVRPHGAILRQLAGQEQGHQGGEREQGAAREQVAVVREQRRRPGMVQSMPACSRLRRSASSAR